MSCSHTQNADTNAANNIVAAGHAVMALVRHSGGGDVRPDAHASAHQAAPDEAGTRGAAQAEAIQALVVHQFEILGY